MQNFTTKYFLRKDKSNSAGKFPIYLRITVGRKPKPYTTSHFVYKNQWDEKHECVINHPLAEEINTDLLQRKKELLQKIVSERVKGEVITAAGIRAKVKGACIFSFSDAFIKEMKGKRTPATLEIWRKHIGKLEEYNGNRILQFQAITINYLANFEAWLRDGGARINKKGGDGANYRHAIMKTIRTHFNQARKKKIIDCYPFDTYEMPDYTAGDKEFLSWDELQTWHDGVEALDADLYCAAVYFLLGCYTGMRLSDWLRFNPKKQVHKNHLALRAKKNGEWIVIPLHNRLREVLGMINKVELIDVEQVMNRRIRLVAAHYNIEKYLSTHSGRRTFAVTMCLEMGISSETAAELMGITVDVFVKNYAAVTAVKIAKETAKAWEGM